MCITLGFPGIQDLLTAIQDHFLIYFIAGFRTKSYKNTLSQISIVSVKKVSSLDRNSRYGYG
jgi:hypothetical protein